MLPGPTFDPWTVQPVANRYTHYATRPPPFNEDITEYASSSGNTATFTLTLWSIKSHIPVKQCHAHNNECYVKKAYFVTFLMQISVKLQSSAALARHLMPASKG